jgi:phosphoglycolate phosphatase-like HAD superfamily hydrolase
LALGDIFEVVICNEHMINKKPHPEGLETALRKLKSSTEQSCYVGDSPEDIEMGRRAQVLTVGVRSTYPTSWKVRNANPDIYLEHFAELTGHFPRCNDQARAKTCRIEGTLGLSERKRHGKPCPFPHAYSCVVRT